MTKLLDESPQYFLDDMNSCIRANEKISFTRSSKIVFLEFNAELDENCEYNFVYKTIPSFDASFKGNKMYFSQFSYNINTGTGLIFVY